MPPFSTLLAALDAYWYVLVAVVIFLGAVWRSLPVELRDKIERSFPRLVGFVRLLIAIFPDLVNAFRAFRIQIVAGEPKRGAAPEAPAKREGFVLLDVLSRAFVFAVSLALALQLSGCPMPPPDGCTPMATRCSPSGVPQRCSQTQRWSSGSLATCGGSATCCLARSPWGNNVHACVPRAQCLPEPSPQIAPPPAPPAAPLASSAPPGAWREWLGLNRSKGGAQ